MVDYQVPDSNPWSYHIDYHVHLQLQYYDTEQETNVPHVRGVEALDRRHFPRTRFIALYITARVKVNT